MDRDVSRGFRTHPVGSEGRADLRPDLGLQLSPPYPSRSTPHLADQVLNGTLQREAVADELVLAPPLRLPPVLPRLLAPQVQHDQRRGGPGMHGFLARGQGELEVAWGDLLRQ